MLVGVRVVVVVVVKITRTECVTDLGLRIEMIFLSPFRNECYFFEAAGTVAKNWLEPGQFPIFIRVVLWYYK